MAEKFPLPITPYSHSFPIAESGFYAIHLTASCRSGRQINQPGGEDLRVEIDDLALREIPPLARTRHYNIPPAWNGTRLQGLSKTVIFLLHLKAGNHLLNFLPYRGATILREPEIDLIEDPAAINLASELQAEAGDRRPWITVALVDLPLKAFSLEATAQGRFRDSDDLKLIIDGQTKPNSSPLAILRRDWLLSGSLLKKLFQTERQSFSFEENLPTGTHYLELWADWTPILHRFKINLGEINSPNQITVPNYKSGRIVIFNDLQPATEVNLRNQPFITTEAETSQVLAILSAGEEFKIIEERVIGEWIPARSFTWHKVKTGQGLIGYVHSSFIEISGQERNQIIENIKQEANELGADANILLAIAGCESRYKPYAASASAEERYKDGSLKAALGVFQLTRPAIQQLKEITGKYYYEVTDPFDVDQNIAAGIRYYLWLKENLYLGVDQSLEKSIVAWNKGQGFVPPDQPLDLNRITDASRRQEAGNFLTCALTNLEKKQWHDIQ